MNKDIQELTELYDLIDKVTNAYDALLRMESDGASGMDISVMNGDHFRPAVEQLIERWENFKTEYQ